jgi:hypothetical protein
MNIVRSELCLVTTRFPGHQSIIEALYKNNSDFKTLCADLLLCSKMIQDFEVEIAEKEHALAEYREIVKDLENELLMLIKAGV